LTNKSDIGFIIDSCGTFERETEQTIKLIEDGLSIPFISRYRKEQTGNMDEEIVNLIYEKFIFLKKLNQRKTAIIKALEKQGKLSDEIKNEISKCYTSSGLEDIYLPFKPKKRTKAVIAKEMGLEELAYDLLNSKIIGSAEKLAEKHITFINEKISIEKALEWAGYIIAEKFSEDTKLRSDARDIIRERGNLESEVKKTFKGKRSKYEQYYKFSESIKNIPSHRVHAIFRGDREGVLKKKIGVDVERYLLPLRKLLFPDHHVRFPYLSNVYCDAIKRLVFPSLENETMNDLKKGADEKSVVVFAKNLEDILLSPPAGNISVIAIDPGFRTGCKIAVLDETGKYIFHTTIFPTKPKEDIISSQKIIKNLIVKYSIEAIVIGNGTASREVYSFIKNNVEAQVAVSVISESGASIYSASKIGREEFPDLDVTIRGAISIGRRFQDPLSELVKLDPKSIGVGQYQHDVDGRLLNQKLESVVSSVVNRVGVDLNNSSAHILRYVSGIGDVISKKIVEFRNKNGMFINREQLKKVDKLGDKSFLQSAGFLRITDGDQILDSTGIHPESYSLVKTISEDLGIDIPTLINNADAINGINEKMYISKSAGEYTIRDIINELKKPGRDPRSVFEPIEFDDSVNSIDDLNEGLVLNGVVTNITNFGVFIDIGVHQDGLAHISELSDQYVKDPYDIVSVGDKLKVKVIHIDKELNRISLSLKTMGANL